MKIQKKSISIIVVAKDGPGELRRLLEGLRGQTVPADEIIIVHVGSTNLSAQLLESYHNRLPLRYFHEPGKGVSFARNKGITVSNGYILAFLTDDCVPCQEWVEVMAQTFSRKTDAQVLQGNLSHVGADRRFHVGFHQADYARGIRHMLDETPGYVTTLDARNFAIRGDIARRFRMPFDERLDANEDEEFWWKLRQEGIQVIFSEEMRVLCYQDGGIASFLSAWRRYGIGKALVMKMHDDFWDYRCVPVKSFESALSWVVREARGLWLREYFRELLSRRLIDALKLYPLAVAQRTAFISGLLHGQKSEVPNYDHFVTPADLFLVITNNCNFRCKHCYFHQKLDEPLQEITAEHVEKIVDSLNGDLRTVSIAGGEPFLNEGLADICGIFSERIHAKSLYIVTNGFHTSQIIRACEEILKKAHFSLTIRVSLDGLSDTHNRIRGNDRAFMKAIETVQGLSRLAKKRDRLRVEIQTTIGNDNFDELGQLAEFVAEELKLFQAFEIIRGSKIAPKIRDFIQPWYGPDDSSTLLRGEQLEKTPEYVRNIYDRYFRNGHFDRYQIDFQALLVSIACQQNLLNRPLAPCAAGESSALILHNCDVAICEMTHPLGNLAEFDFDLKRLLMERFNRDIKMRRDSCHCAMSCSISSSIQTGRIRNFVPGCS